MEQRLLKDAEAATMLSSTAKTLAVWRCQGKGPRVTQRRYSARKRIIDGQ